MYVIAFPFNNTSRWRAFFYCCCKLYLVGSLLVSRLWRCCWVVRFGWVAAAAAATNGQRTYFERLVWRKNNKHYQPYESRNKEHPLERHHNQRKKKSRRFATIILFESIKNIIKVLVSWFLLLLELRIKRQVKTRNSEDKVDGLLSARLGSAHTAHSSAPNSAPSCQIPRQQVSQQKQLLVGTERGLI